MMNSSRQLRAGVSTRNPWRLLTARGRWFGLIGLTAIIGGMLTDQRDIIRIGVLLVAVPLLALLLVTGARLRLTCRRDTSPNRVQLGSGLTGRISIWVHSGLPAGMVMLEDRIPPELGARPRFHLDRSSAKRTVEYPLVGRVRGRWTCGPLLIRTTDPFGLVQLDRRFTTTNEVLVTPRLVQLAPLYSVGNRGRRGETHADRIGVVGADDVLIREYRHGDDVRRVHWPSTARRNELMVRREEQASDPSARIILDSRIVAHAGSGMDSSWEWAVSAAASVGLHFLGTGYSVDMFDADGKLSISPDEEHGRMSSESLILRLSELRARRTTSLRYGIEAAAAARRSHLVVAIIGRLSIEEAHLLLRAQPPGTSGLAVLLDVDSFARAADPGKTSQEGPASGRLRGASEKSGAVQHSGDAAGDAAPTDSPAMKSAASEVLRANGWRVTVAQHQTSVADAWARFAHEAAR